MKAIGNSALIVEGGAMRGVFSCGVLDHFLSVNFSPFDSFWGVSAGASNVAAYLANMPGRNLKIYADYSCRKEFFTPVNFIRGGDLLDIDWLWKATMQDLGMDLEAIEKDGRPFFLGLTNKSTGQPEYHLAQSSTLIETMKASSALPVMYKQDIALNGQCYVDGGASDSIPVAEAIRRGAKKIMVLRSRPYSYKKSPAKMPSFYKRALRKSPGLIQPMLRRAQQYNESLELIRHPPLGVDIIEICPPESFKLKRLTRESEPLIKGYELGLDLGKIAILRWQEENN